MNNIFSLTLKNQVIFLTLLFLSIFELTENTFRTTGDYMLTLLLYLSLSILILAPTKNYGSLLSQRDIIIVICLYFVTIFTSSFINNDFNINLILKLLGSFTFIIISIKTTWRKKSIIYISYIISISIFYLLLDWFFGISTSPFRDFTSGFRNPNGLAILLFCGTYFIILSFHYVSNKLLKSFFITMLLISLFLISETGARSISLSIFIVILILLINKYRRNLAYYAFFIALGFNLLFILIYVKLPNTTIGYKLNNISTSLFSKGFFSGREHIWSEVWNHSINSPLIGHGISSKAGHINGVNTSTHNQYLQIFMESGVIGLTFFLIFLYLMWGLLSRNLNTFEGALSAGFFIATVIYSNYELTLFQNNFHIGMIQWLIITIGISDQYKKSLSKGVVINELPNK
ncbi:hypothetical protein GCM10012290_25930 [Halolactibacillus alkaliphilus]|uniref:O-antigen ligase-related domain-containing protein n=1 Tax=Halolactibacillus alkaliphilus TaxID=442899 RepID=A0A511X519_9BACI|nr:O-antigen ligase family protein [Halolactibacillus alkaliphilus]GEN58052.1 hypothetical protein HAL01_25160 [Halolactibacillus alkaliphilus]GGN76308.1 hypothetical protein GCM10012290_25930 [Halolactibacillus alkaliphilus]SFP13380.1 O-antigen ligase [Halolactibacillus alkaliphilus]